MTETRRLIPRPATVGDAAVDGLLDGVLAGIAMLVFLIIVGLVLGETPLQLLARFDPGPRGEFLRGGLMHLAVSGVYGMSFGVLWRAFLWRGGRSRVTVLAGLAYGVGLYLIAETILLPGSHSALADIPAWSFALAHLVYGVTLGLLFNRIRND